MNGISTTCTIVLLVVGLSTGATPKADDAPARKANRLARETSPYLLQHAHNPVDWYPWGPEAFERAKRDDKPIFLSIGYSSCFWCHVMERECFEDAEIARQMNENFICIKVDREERPDVDQVYMTALQAFAGNGGWPMSMFLTPDGRPFFGGTYFPPADKGPEHPPAFPKVLDAVANAWRDQRKEIDETATKVSEAVRRFASRSTAQSSVPLSMSLVDGGVSVLAEQFDPDHGGFGYSAEQPRKPKFPEPTNLVFLLDVHRRTGDPEALKMVLTTLDHLARGGIRDHLGGGYHRYTVDRAWQVPHFEKMLYDNAQLASVFLAAFEITQDARWKDEAKNIFAFVTSELTAPQGGFYSSLDAEAEGEEGASYIWTKEEIQRVLGSDFDLFSHAYGVDRAPNFEGDRYVLLQPVLPSVTEEQIAPARAKLLAARQKRPKPRLDDKVLTSWNALMISAYADGARVLKDESYRRAADRAADFLWEHLRTADGRLLRTWRDGQAKLPAYLEDYAYFADGLLRLHAATGDERRIKQARELADRVLIDFQDDTGGGFFSTADDHESLIARFKDPFDNALPGANTVAIRALLSLSTVTGEPRYREAALKALNAFAPTMRESPSGVPLMLVALTEALVSAPAPAQEPKNDDPLGLGNRDVLTATAALEPATATPKPGDTITIKVTLTVKEGWHVYANPVGAELLRPTVVELEPKAPAKLVTVEYPRGIPMPQPAGDELANVYEGPTTIRLKARLNTNVPKGELALPLRIQYQACNDRLCLAPARLLVTAKLNVVGP